MGKGPLRMGVVGSGAIAQRRILPHLTRWNVARHFGAAVVDDVDGVEVASPRSTLFSRGQTADVAVKPVHAGVAD